MLRNDVITLLGEKDNDLVVVSVNGTLLDVEAVADDRGCIVLVLKEDDRSDVDERDTGSPDSE